MNQLTLVMKNKLNTCICRRSYELQLQRDRKEMARPLG